MCTDLFGSKFATTNTSMLYTAKGAAAFLVPVGGMFAIATGNWNDVLFLATGINVIAVILVCTVLRPAANRHHTMDKVEQPELRSTVNSNVISTN